MDYYEIKSYGVAMTTLEEVFLNINEELSGEKKDDDRKSNETGLKQQLINTKSDMSADQNNSMSSSNHSSFDANKDSDDEEEGAYLVRGSNCCHACSANI